MTFSSSLLFTMSIEKTVRLCYYFNNVILISNKDLNAILSILLDQINYSLHNTMYEI